jgi:Protein of unknown function (DUF1207)
VASARFSTEDPSDLKPGAIEYGLEFYSPWRLAPGIRPVAAIDLQNRQQNNWQLDISARAGLQFESVQVLGRKLLLMLEYFGGTRQTGNSTGTASTTSAWGCTCID